MKHSVTVEICLELQVISLELAGAGAFWRPTVYRYGPDKFTLTG